MMAEYYPLQVLLPALSGWVSREQQRTIGYLVEENRVRASRPMIVWIWRGRKSWCFSAIEYSGSTGKEYTAAIAAELIPRCLGGEEVRHHAR
jgi:hypothetical protein